MSGFLSGMITMGYLLAALFFFRFWWRTKDMLFTFFGVSFLLLALSQTLSALAGIASEDQSWIYLLRLAAFTLLIVGIIAKNTERTRNSRARE
jgi:hypothetical protein